jgi:hypothetical protein
MDLKKSIYFFVASITMYCLSGVLCLGLGLFSGAIWTLIVFTSLGSALFFAKKILTDFTFENKYFRFFFWLLFIYNLQLIARGAMVDYKGFKDLIHSDFLFWPYMLPLLVFWNKDTDGFVYLMEALFYLGVVFLLACIAFPFLILNRVPGEDFIHPFAFGCGFLLLNSRYLTPKKQAIVFIVLLVAILSMTYLARRNGIVTYVGLTLAALGLNFLRIKATKFFKLIPVFSGIIIISIFGIDMLPASLTSRITDRLTEDSRSDLFSSFFKEMDDYKYVGKGMNGTYYFPSGGELADEGVTFTDVQYRNVIENGYLQLFLNGGIVYDVIFVLLLLPAAILGFFKSKNQLAKSCGVIIFLWLIDMIVYGMPRLTMGYILVWIAVGACYKQSFREQTNEEIEEAFNKE